MGMGLCRCRRHSIHPGKAQGEFYRSAIQGSSASGKATLGSASPGSGLSCRSGMKKQETVRPEEGARSGGKKGTSMGDAGLHHLSTSPWEQTQNIVVITYSEGGVLAPAVTKPPSGPVKSQIKR